MTNEEFQRIVLQELRGLKEGQSKLEEGQSKLEARQSKLEEGQRSMAEDIREIKHNQSFIWDDIKRLDKRLETQNNKIKRIAP